MSLTRKAKTLSSEDVHTVLEHMGLHSRYPLRDKLIFYLSYYCGLRAIEISSITIESVYTKDGDNWIPSKSIRVYNNMSKGKRSGREIPMPHEMIPILLAYLVTLQEKQGNIVESTNLIQGERSDTMSSVSIRKVFNRIYSCLPKGYSSHSGRRSFGTKIARKIPQVDGVSIRDLQELLGHSSLSSTTHYIDPNYDLHSILLNDHT